MVILIDLDGTLTNTSHPQFKKMKDGIVDTIISSIPVSKNIVEIITNKKNGPFNKLYI